MKYNKKNHFLSQYLVVSDVDCGVSTAYRSTSQVIKSGTIIHYVADKFHKYDVF